MGSQTRCTIRHVAGSYHEAGKVPSSLSLWVSSTAATRQVGAELKHVLLYLISGGRSMMAEMWFCTTRKYPVVNNVQEAS